jgi:endonuclease/exonuclease/phosphatase family metal-dependent hydrolase
VPERVPGRRLPTLAREEPRVGVVAEISPPSGPVTVVNTHLSFLPWWNRHQLRALVAAVASAPRPLLVLGDLNMGPEKAGALSGLSSLARHPTFPAEAPTRQLDHVLVDGPLRAESSRTLQMSLSDHRALVVDLT